MVYDGRAVLNCYVQGPKYRRVGVCRAQSIRLSCPKVIKGPIFVLDFHHLDTLGQTISLRITSPKFVDGKKNYG